MNNLNMKNLQTLGQRIYLLADMKIDKRWVTPKYGRYSSLHSTVINICSIHWDFPLWIKKPE